MNLAVTSHTKVKIALKTIWLQSGLNLNEDVKTEIAWTMTRSTVEHSLIVHSCFVSTAETKIVCDDLLSMAKKPKDTTSLVDIILK